MQEVLSNPFITYNTPKSFNFLQQAFVEQDVILGLIYSLSEVKLFYFITKLATKHATLIVVTTRNPIHSNSSICDLCPNQPFFQL